MPDDVGRSRGPSGYTATLAASALANGGGCLPHLSSEWRLVPLGGELMLLLAGLDFSCAFQLMASAIARSLSDGDGRSVCTVYKTAHRLIR